MPESASMAEPATGNGVGVVGPCKDLDRNGVRALGVSPVSPTFDNIHNDHAAQLGHSRPGRSMRDNSPAHAVTQQNDRLYRVVHQRLRDGHQILNQRVQGQVCVEGQWRVKHRRGQRRACRRPTLCDTGATAPGIATHPARPLQRSCRGRAGQRPRRARRIASKCPAQTRPRTVPSGRRRAASAAASFPHPGGRRMGKQAKTGRQAGRQAGGQIRVRSATIAAGRGSGCSPLT